MMRVLAESWWFLLVRGIFALGLGILGFSARAFMGTLLFESIVLSSLEIYFSVFAIASGLITMAAAVRAIGKDKWMLLMLDGATAIAAGLAVEFFPGLTFLGLLRCMAAWAVILGLIQFSQSVHVQRHRMDEWLLAVSGAGLLMFAVLLLAGHPETSLGLLYWMSGFALFSAASMIALSFRFRQWLHHSQEIAEHATHSKLPEAAQ